MKERFHSRESAAAYCTSQGFKTAKSTLQKLACYGGGPPYRLFGIRVVYSESDLDAWIEGRLSGLVRSTSELPAKPKKAKPALDDAAPVKKRGRPKKIVAADPGQKRKPGRPRKIVADAVQAAPKAELIKASGQVTA